MLKRNSRVKFIRERSVVTFDDKILVDLREVNMEAKAHVFSGVTADFDGIETSFSIIDSSHPFNIEITALSPAGLVQAIIENRLEIDGMEVTEKIQHAYEYLLNSNSIGHYQ